MKKKLLIMGSSGSIGKSTLEVVRQNPELFSVTGLAVNTSTAAVIEQAREFLPSVVAVRDQAAAAAIAGNLPPGTELVIGQQGLQQIAALADYDIFVGAMVGFAGLIPTLEAIRRGKRIALANKETLVVAGQLVTELCKRYKAELLPVDSEHSAIFQCLYGEASDAVQRLILTASGGPFYQLPKSDFEKISIEQALNHPTWKMGSKITIDSATLMNKGLEVIEARWLFGLPQNRIDVVIHPQSIIHSMVEFVDGSIKAQLSVPDMKLPIHYALNYPNRVAASYIRTDFLQIGTLTFANPDTEKFECLQLAYDVLAEGGKAPCILNAANEVAVAGFLKGQIGFTKIPRVIRSVLEKIPGGEPNEIEEIIECDVLARKAAEQVLI
ncbi:MAG: 1-deoxy-D-xylulose-5-phosphate reductoisomerase [Ignavibacteria bacterium]|nr:1-deoxy-D-xylulose-5-phosphate reductoisomerase [Ignavibacteria bacterium]